MAKPIYRVAVDHLDTPNCSVCLSRMEAVELADEPGWVCLDCITA